MSYTWRRKILFVIWREIENFLVAVIFGGRQRVRGGIFGGRHGNTRIFKLTRGSGFADRVWPTPTLHATPRAVVVVTVTDNKKGWCLVFGVDWGVHQFIDNRSSF